ncbi:MAG: hypothetical protein ACRDQ4_22570 [Pseudonocardiaceae bacterium]
MDTDDERWNALSRLLAQERNTGSFMSLLLDRDLVSRATEQLDERSRVLDFGSGTGALAFAVAWSGAQVDATIARLASWTRIGGRLLLVVPHPLKDYGDWHRDPPGGDAISYRFYVLHDYLREGVCLKTRENRHGQVTARDVPSHHRTISSYFNALLRHGFDVREMVEPAPAAADADTEPVLYAKSSRIPYFLLFDCRRQGPTSSQ